MRRRVVIGLVVLVAATAVAFRLSPWPTALLVRVVFDRGGERASAALAPYVPDDVTTLADEPYDPTDPDALLDVHLPGGTVGSDRVLPTVVWVHGGAWMAGDRSQVANYLRILADRGFAVVGVGYSLAPGHTYPTPVAQVTRALEHLDEHGERLHVDRDQLVLAGDSAGAQIAAQVAALVTDPGYADQVGIRPDLDPSQLVATVLFCGSFDTAALGADTSGVLGWFIRSVVRGYAGTRSDVQDGPFALAAVSDHVTAAFPPSFVSAGNDDPLEPQSRRLATALEDLEVEVDTLFFPDDQDPPLGHEYQFDLDTEAGRTALDRAVAFLEAHVTDAAAPAP